MAPEENLLLPVELPSHQAAIGLAVKSRTVSSEEESLFLLIKEARLGLGTAVILIHLHHP